MTCCVPVAFPQETGLVGVVVASGEHELDALFLDWHDKTHAALAKAGIQL